MKTPLGALTLDGISDPKAVLSNIRKIASQIELRNPTLSIRDRQKIALAQVADSDFIAKINFWFDQTVDRVFDTFTAWTRMVTLVFALAISAAINLNSVDLVHRLWINDKTRDILVKENKNVPDNTKSDLDKKPKANPPSTPKTGTAQRALVSALTEFLGILHFSVNTFCN